MFSKVIGCLEKSNSQMNAKHLKTNRLQIKSNTKEMNRVENIQIKVWKYKAVECLKR